MTVHSPSCRYAADHSGLYHNRRLRQRRAFWPAAAGLLLLFSELLSPGWAQTSKHSATYIQVVNKADPNLEWTPPAPLHFGEQLSFTQLSATARTPGNFAYTPAPGTILQPGMQLLSVAFTPANPNYLSASGSVPLTVTPPGNSTFQLKLDQSLPGGNKILLFRNREASIPLNIAPDGDFHQPITLSCSHPANIACTIIPGMVRPTTAPIQAMLTVRWMSSADSQTGLTRGVPSGRQSLQRLPFVPLVSAVFLLGALSLRKRRLQFQRSFPSFGFLALAAILACSLIGCGGWEQSEQIVIVAKSLVESRNLPIAIYLEQ